MSDALATLRTALGDKAGMRRIPFPLESYQSPSIPLESKRLLNLYAEQQPADARAPAALIPTPGLDFIEGLGVGPVLAFDTALVGGYYAVSGTNAFRHSDGVTVDLGFVGAPTDPLLPQHVMATIAASPTDVVICIPPNLYTAPHNVNVLTPIPTAGWAGGGANSITYMDGYFVATQHGRGTTFFFSALNDPTTWDALDFASIEGLDNIILRAITHRNELWFLGAAGIEVWYNSGDVDLPFRRQSGGVIPHGVNPRTVATIDGSVWWVGTDRIIYRSAGYKAERVSTNAVEAIIERLAPDISQGFGIAYVQEGHAFYCINFADIGRTLCYDCLTKTWHDRSSAVDGVGEWRARVAATIIGGTTYVGDASGRLYSLNLDGTTDNGVSIIRQFVTPPVYAGSLFHGAARVFNHRLEVEMEVGAAVPSGDITVEWSNDGGVSYTGARILTGAPTGATRQRMYTTRLGSFRQRSYRVTAHGKATFFAVDADFAPGA